MNAFGKFKLGVLFALALAWLAACTSGGPQVSPVPEKEVRPQVTVNPAPLRVDEARERDSLHKHKLEESDRIVHALKSIASPAAIGVMGLSQDFPYPGEL